MSENRTDLLTARKLLIEEIQNDIPEYYYDDVKPKRFKSDVNNKTVLLKGLVRNDGDKQYILLYLKNKKGTKFYQKEITEGEDKIDENGDKIHGYKLNRECTKGGFGIMTLNSPFNIYKINLENEMMIHFFKTEYVIGGSEKYHLELNWIKK